MTEQEMGAWYFYWHHVFSVPYSDDLRKKIEAEKIRQMSLFVGALIEGFVFVALNSPAEVRKWKKASKEVK